MSRKLDRKLIEALPICDEGREKVTELIKAMGYEVESEHPKPKPGQVWVGGCGGWVYLLIHLKGKYTAINMNGARRWEEPTSDPEEAVRNLKFAANSVEEYYAKITNTER